MASHDPEWLRFVRHVPCGECDSRNAGALYGDGHTYCWRCEHYESGSPNVAEPEDVFTSGKLVASRPRRLKKRNIKIETAVHFGYGEGRARNPETERMERCHVAPYYDERGKLVSQKLRFRGKVFLTAGATKNATLFGQHLWKPHARGTVVITEGELDAMAVAQVQDLKWATVSLRAGAKSYKDLLRSIEWLDGFKRIVLMFDNDADGQDAAEQAAALLPPGKAFIASLPLNDPCDMLREGRGSEIIDAMWNAKSWRPDGLVWGEDAWALYTRSDKKPSIPYSHPVLDRAFEGHRDAEIVTVCAGTMVGKSAFMREEAYHMNRAGLKVGIIALEEPVRRQIQGLCSIAMEMPLHLRECADVDEADIQEVFLREFPNVVFDNHQGSLASDRLIQKMRYMARGLGCRRIILDHLTIVVAGQSADNDRKVIDELMTNLVSLTEETGVGVFLVCHLKRPKDGRGFEQGRPISLGDLRGSSLIEALSNDVIGLERDIEAEDVDDRLTTRIHGLKCRWTADVGYKGFLRWHGDRCRLLPDEEYTLEEAEEDGPEDFQDGGR